MIDPNSQFFAILTAVGEAKQANADALGIPWKLTELGVGDANGTDPIPDREQKTLINERRRRQLNKLSIDPANPNILIAEQIIPADEGGWWIREIGLYDADGDLVAVANCAPSYKPLMSQGSGRTQVVRMNFIVSSATNVFLKIDPAVVLATRQYVDDSVVDAINRQDIKQSVLVATTGPIQLTGVQTIDGVAVPFGSRVLVKDQPQGKDNGLYLTADAWKRTSDADTSSKVTPSMLVAVEQGVRHADTLWHLVTDSPIVLGTTTLNFRNFLNGLAPLESPLFTGSPKGTTPARFSSDEKLATTEFVMGSRGSFAGGRGVSQSRVLTAEDVGMRLEIAAGVLATLPPTSSVPDGSAFLISAGPFSNTSQIGIANGDQLAMNNLSVRVPYTMSQGGDVLLIREGNIWRGHCGTETLRTSKLFNVALDSYWASQDFPTGFIIKTGKSSTTVDGVVPVTFPLAFPTVCITAVANYGGASSAISPSLCQTGIPTRTGFTGYLTAVQTNTGSVTNGGFTWIAIGY